MLVIDGVIRGYFSYPEIKAFHGEVAKIVQENPDYVYRMEPFQQPVFAANDLNPHGSIVGWAGRRTGFNLDHYGPSYFTWMIGPYTHKDFLENIQRLEAQGYSWSECYAKALEMSIEVVQHNIQMTKFAKKAGE